MGTLQTRAFDPSITQGKRHWSNVNESKLPDMHSLSLKLVCVCVFMCVPMDVFVWCMYACVWHACGSQRTTRGVSLHCPPYLKQGLFLVCCCICQGSGPWAPMDTLFSAPPPFLYRNMGITYMSYCAQPRMGSWDLNSYHDVATGSSSQPRFHTPKAVMLLGFVVQ